MYDGYENLMVLQDHGKLDTEAASSQRAALAARLSTCMASAAVSYIESSVGPRDSHITLLDVAVAADSAQLTTSLLSSGLSVSGDPGSSAPHHGSGDFTSVDLAAQMESSKALRAFLAAGVEVRGPNSKGRNALRVIGSQTHARFESAALLVDAGADVNAEDDHRATPLIMARQNADMRLVECLVLLGAHIPSPETLHAFSVRDSRRDTVRNIDAFLGGPRVVDDLEVLHACRSKSEL